MAGASGLVGRALLADLLADESVRTVHALVRRPLNLTHPKLVSHKAELADPGAPLPTLQALDEAYIALGTTIAQAGSQAAFYAVDHDAVLRAAQAARKAGAAALGVVSAMGADPHSRIFYNRVKGETESDLRAMGWSCLVLARPSLLVGDRASLGQVGRPGEGLALRATAWARPLIPASLRPISAADVASALRLALRRGTVGQHVLTNGEMLRLAKSG